MILHLFNPWHDEALAAHSPYYYPSKPARQLAAQWALLPLLWASAGDALLLPDANVDGHLAPAPRWADPAIRSLLPPHLQLLTPAEAQHIDWQHVHHIDPWGWDPLVRQRLHRMGAPAHLLPTDAALQQLRTLSSRATTAALLPHCVAQLQALGLPVSGQSVVVHSAEALHHWVHTWQHTFCKSLWSCSGRGVSPLQPSSPPAAWARVQKWITTQGGVEVQRACRAQHDIALLFEAQPTGTLQWCGSSHFRVGATGSYQGNYVLTEAAMTDQIEALLPSAPRGWLQQVARVVSALLAAHLQGHYVGPLGVDMLIATATDGTPTLMPCIEVNLRRTMGHAAHHLAALSPHPQQQKELAESLSLGKLFTF